MKNLLEKPERLASSASLFAANIAAIILLALVAHGTPIAEGFDSSDLLTLVTATVLLSPHLFTYDLALLLLPAFLLFVLIGAGGVTLLLSVTLTMAFLAFVCALWLRSRGIETPDAIRGKLGHASIANPQAYERANYIKVLQGYGSH